MRNIETLCKLLGKYNSSAGNRNHSDLYSQDINRVNDCIVTRLEIS